MWSLSFPYSRFKSKYPKQNVVEVLVAAQRSAALSVICVIYNVLELFSKGWRGGTCSLTALAMRSVSYRSATVGTILKE